MSLSVALRLGRVSNLPTVWTNCIAGAALAGAFGLSPVGAGAVVAVAASLSVFYVGGMYLNDAFDQRIDALERPERPIPSGQISAAAVFVVGFALLALGVAGLGLSAAFLAHASPLRAMGAGLGTAALIVVYDAYHKGNPLSPVLMGLCRVGVYVSACFALGGDWSAELLLASGALLAYLIGLTYVAKQENLKQVKHLWPLVFLLVPFAYAAPVATCFDFGVFVYAGLALWVVFALTLLRRTPPQIPRAVVSFIAGISLVDALVVSVVGVASLIPQAGFWPLVCVAGFALTLLSQRWIKGT